MNTPKYTTITIYKDLFYLNKIQSSILTFFKPIFNFFNNFFNIFFIKDSYLSIVLSTFFCVFAFTVFLRIYFDLNIKLTIKTKKKFNLSYPNLRQNQIFYFKSLKCFIYNVIDSFSGIFNKYNYLQGNSFKYFFYFVISIINLLSVLLVIFSLNIFTYGNFIASTLEKVINLSLKYFAKNEEFQIYFLKNKYFGSYFVYEVLGRFDDDKNLSIVLISIIVLLFVGYFILAYQFYLTNFVTNKQNMFDVKKVFNFIRSTFRVSFFRNKILMTLVSYLTYDVFTNFIADVIFNQAMDILGNAFKPIVILFFNYCIIISDIITIKFFKFLFCKRNLNYKNNYIFDIEIIKKNKNFDL